MEDEVDEVGDDEDGDGDGKRMGDKKSRI